MTTNELASEWGLCSVDGGPSIYVHGDDGFLLTFLQSTVLTVLPAVNLQPEWIRILLLWLPC